MWHSTIDVLVLTDKLGRCLVGLANLQHWVRVNSLALALLAEVGISINAAHVTDASDRVCFAAVADDVFVDDFVLIESSLMKVVDEHLLKFLGAVVLDLLSNCSS